MKKFLKVMFCSKEGITLLFWIAMNMSIEYWLSIDLHNTIYYVVMIVSRFGLGYSLARVAVTIWFDRGRAKHESKKKE